MEFTGLIFSDIRTVFKCVGTLDSRVGGMTNMWATKRMVLSVDYILFFPHALGLGTLRYLLGISTEA